MDDYLRASQEGLKIVKDAGRKKGWTQTVTQEWWVRANTSQATLKRFWRGKSIDGSAFRGICTAVEIDWRQVAELSEIVELPAVAISRENLDITTVTTSADLNSNFVGREEDFGVRLKRRRRLKRRIQTKRVGILMDSLEPALDGQGRNGDTLINDLEGYTSCVSDWDYAPHVEPFYGREVELEQLKGWIADEDRSRRSCLVVLYGMGGIGKTYLAIKAGKQLEEEFNFLIFRSVKNTPSLPKLIASIEDIINPGYISTAKLSVEESITKLINSLKKRRCLIILDDLESIFDPNNFAGRYLPEFESYAELIQRIAIENHESSVLIVSREKVTEYCSPRRKSGAYFADIWFRRDCSANYRKSGL